MFSVYVMQTHYELVACRQSPGDEVTSPTHHPPTAGTPSEYGPNDDYERVMTGAMDVQQVPTAAVCTDLGMSAGGPQNDSLTLALSPPPAYTVLDGHRATPIHQVAAQQTSPDVLSRRAAPQVQGNFFRIMQKLQ
jgi:hypothetical protein